ncbi:MAG: glycosyltransferase [Planctomycetes bacterium]|nr:glycosyltransferase [Planctomycetota bacterium]
MALDPVSKAARDSAAKRRDTARVNDRGAGRATDKVEARSKPDTGRVDPAQTRNWRVCVVAPPLEFGGLALYTSTLVRALIERGDDVMLVARDGPMRQTLTGLKYTSFVLPAGKLGFFGWRKLRDAVSEFEPDILHAISPDRTLPSVRLADAVEKPLCVSVHGVKPTDLPKVEDADFDGYLAADANVREKLINDCRLPRRLVTQINLAMAPVRQPAEEHVLDARATPAVGMLGPLEEGLGFGAFMDAVSAISAKNPEPIFTILGDGPRRAEVRRMTEDRNLLQRIVLVDRLYDYSLAWRPFDIVFVDTRQPASGMMVLGAMAFGLPVVATEGGSVFDIVEDGVDGLLVQRDDADHLEQRLLMLIENHHERLRMGRAAYAEVESKYSPQRMALSLHETYSAMVAGEPLPRQGEVSAKRSAKSGA